MEWRGGMVPHLGFPGQTKNEPTTSHDRAPLRLTSQDWSQFRGPGRDGHIPPASSDINYTSTPKLRWQTPCGKGHSSIITSGSHAITLEQDDKDEILIARSIDDGSEVWRVSVDTKWDDMMSGEGPRSTPTLVEGKIYAIFSNGLLACVDSSDGRIFWKTMVIEEDYDFPEWGIACSPLVWGDVVILNLGGKQGSVKAYGATSGKLQWTSEFSGNGVYLSPSILNLCGENHLLAGVKGKIAGINPSNGKIIWEKSWKIFLNNAQIVQPIALSESSIILAAGYGKGAECWQFSRDKVERYQIETSWKSKDLKAKFSNPVLKDGYLYGLSENLLVCLEAKSGKLMWRGKKYGYGRILASEKNLFILGSTGVLSIVEAIPNEFREISSRQLLSDARCWNGPAFVNGYLLARNGEQIACFDFGK
jgi:outer membrane protein assembly factor BamB